MSYPTIYDDCTVIDTLTTIDIIDYDRIQAMITENKVAVCECSTTSSLEVKAKLDVIDSGLRQVISEVTDEVNENQTIIEGTGIKVIV